MNASFSRRMHRGLLTLMVAVFLAASAGIFPVLLDDLANTSLVTSAFAGDPEETIGGD